MTVLFVADRRSQTLDSETLITAGDVIFATVANLCFYRCQIGSALSTVVSSASPFTAHHHLDAVLGPQRRCTPQHCLFPRALCARDVEVPPKVALGDARTALPGSTSPAPSPGCSRRRTARLVYRISRVPLRALACRKSVRALIPRRPAVPGHVPRGAVRCVVSTVVCRH